MIVGAGNVGAQIGYLSLFISGIEEVMLYDIQSELCRGKVLDLSHSAGVLGKDIVFSWVESLNLAIAHLVVITAGMPRKEGMSRFDLLDFNLKIVKEVIENLNPQVLKQSIFIMVSNPVDVLTYYFCKKANLERKRCIGMAGALDLGRFRYYLSQQLGKKLSSLQPLVIGAHSKDMVCLYPGEELESIKPAIAETKNSGAEIVSLYKGGSAYFAPAAGVILMLENILGNKKSVLPAVAVLEGEYGYKNVAFGVPLKLSQGGIEEIVELELSQSEREELNLSVQPIRDAIAYIEQKGFL